MIYCYVLILFVLWCLVFSDSPTPVFSDTGVLWSKVFSDSPTPVFGDTGVLWSIVFSDSPTPVFSDTGVLWSIVFSNSSTPCVKCCECPSSDLDNAWKTRKSDPQ